MLQLKDPATIFESTLELDMQFEQEEIKASYEAADLATDLWERGDRADAVRTLLKAFEDNGACCSDWSWLASTWQIRLEQPDSESLLTLRVGSTTLPQWHLTNALLLYRILGDTPVSRGALKFALEDGDPLVRRLLSLPPDDFPFGTGLVLDGPQSYLAQATDCWQQTPGAVQWLEAMYKDAAAEIDEPPASPTENDKKYRKLWLDHLEAGFAFRRREEFGKAKNSFLSSLREARKLGLFRLEVRSSLLGLFSIRCNELMQVRELLVDQVKAAKQMSTTDPVKAIRLLAGIARSLEAANGNPVEIDDCLNTAVKLFEALPEAEKLRIDYSDRANLYLHAAEFWDKHELTRSRAQLEYAVECLTAFLGDRHESLIQPLAELHQRYDFLDEMELAEGVKTRGREISSAFDGILAQMI